MRRLLNCIGIIGLLTAGCGTQGPPASTADPGAALSALAGDSGAALVGSIAGSINSRCTWADPRMLEQMVAEVAPLVAADFEPAGCATTEAKGTVLTVKFTNCTGPGGKVQLNGTFVAAFAAAPPPNTTAIVMTYGGRLEIRATTGDVNSLTVTVNASATILPSEIKRFTVKIDGTAVTSTTTWGSRDASLTGKVTITVTDTCVGIDGAITLGGGPGGSTTTVKNLETCKRRCATGAATLTGPNVMGSVTWSGTSEVAWQLNGKSGTIAVPCGN